jgi:uncharacterized protein YjiS (DUF1127 family)
MIDDTRALLANFFRTLMRWQVRAEQRRVLSELDDSALRDIGLTRDEALAEASRPFWSGGEGSHKRREAELRSFGDRSTEELRLLR